MTSKAEANATTTPNSANQNIYAPQPQAGNIYPQPQIAYAGQQPNQAYMNVPPPSYDNSVNPNSPSYNYAQYPNGYPVPGPIPTPVPVQPVQANFGKQPVEMVCPFCKKLIHTKVEYENNIILWITVLILFFFTLVFFWIPFLVNEIKDRVHFCPECGNEINRKSPF